MNNLERTRRRNDTLTTEEITLLSFILDHVNERLNNLTPGINCTIEQYQALRKEKLRLTLSVNRRKMDLRGLTFEKDSVFVYNNVFLKLGGTYCQKLRA